MPKFDHWHHEPLHSELDTKIKLHSKRRLNIKYSREFLQSFGLHLVEHTGTSRVTIAQTILDEAMMFLQKRFPNQLPRTEEIEELAYQYFDTYGNVT